MSPTDQLDALVLGGGNLKGAYQAGAVSALLRAGFAPGIVTGISAGALNAGYLAGRATAHAVPDWPAIGQELEDFWRANVKRPGDFVRRRGFLAVAWSALTRRWNGLVDTDPLASVVHRVLGETDPSQTGVALRVGAVNIRTGDLTYVGRSEPRLVDYIMASTAEPVGMPLRVVGGEPFYDGGLRDVAPLKQAIELGARRIAVVACQPAKVQPVAPEFCTGDPLPLISRVLEIVTNELLQSDLEWFLEVNSYVRAGQQHPVIAGKRFIPILIIRPAERIAVSLEKFTPADIDRMIGQGNVDASREIGAARASVDHPGHDLAMTLQA